MQAGSTGGCKHGEGVGVGAPGLLRLSPVLLKRGIPWLERETEEETAEKGEVPHWSIRPDAGAVPGRDTCACCRSLEVLRECMCASGTLGPVAAAVLSGRSEGEEGREGEREIERKRKRKRERERE